MANHKSIWKVWAGLNGAFAVAMSAVAVHAIKEAAAIALVEKAALFQFGFAVVLLVLADKPTRADVVARWVFLLGIVLFSGTLYFKAFMGMGHSGMLAPLGGTCFILGWLVLAIF